MSIIRDFIIRPASRAAWIAVAPLMAAASPAAEPAPDFAREVRPILASHCFKCHGPDDKARKSGLRLDVPEGALAAGDSGAVAVVPGRPDESEVIRRLLAEDPDDLMPPPAVKHPMSAAKIEVLRRWVAAGARYEKHWAYMPPQQAPLPSVQNKAWPRTAIDYFVLARLEAESLSPAPEADRATLVRRLSLDLTGLPPTLEEADAFINDAAPDAYERLVDRLLASPRYGERWARRWLDLARYADTNGYEKDRPRSIWPWRDWVIRALNADMPFDRFTTEQLAGDLLPDASEESVIATGFHRNTMLNEEGGIDPLEFRFHAMTDRVSTTGTTWLGLTLGCAQCHTHKSEPIQHHEYYQIMAFLNNADEPSHQIGAGESDSQRRDREDEIARLIAALPSRWPLVSSDDDWQPVRPSRVTTASGESPRLLEDGSALFQAPGPERETTTLVLETTDPEISRLRLDALTDPSLPRQGPGRVTHGNFVLSEVRVTAEPLDGSTPPRPIEIATATANAEQSGFPVSQAFDGSSDTGWAVHVNDATLNQPKSAEWHFATAVAHPSGTRFTITLEQSQGGYHTIGRIRLSIPKPDPNPSADEAVRRQTALQQSENRWITSLESKAADWTTPRPASMTTNLPKLEWQGDGSVFASGDFTKEDHYELRYAAVPAGVTALRIETLPDPRLPEHGPGITYYEGPRGDFFIGHLTVASPTGLAAIARTSATAGNAGLMIDDNRQSGWGGSGQTGERSAAVLVLDAPWPGGELVLRFESGRHYSASLGRFRVSFTSRPGGAEALAVDPEVEDILSRPADSRSPADREVLRRAFLLSAPELASETKRLPALQRGSRGQETLVLRERPTDNPRVTRRHHRGEYLQPEEPVAPGVPAFLPPLPPGAPTNRLGFARWLVSADNPLTPRVTVNRQWAAFFGTGLVKTLGDFGYQGEPPTHPELLDWLAIHFVQDGWSLKRLHKLIVTSSTYRQASSLTPELRARDPLNRLLARGPRFRVEAEIVRDIALRASDLLSDKMFGPPVRPPQPAGVTETAYGGAGWDASTGEDRYRRALYTFAKRSAPFAATSTFDAPSGEACVARREQSNTPLQSLTLLNDPSFIEAAQALGRIASEGAGDDAAKLTAIFRRCLTRPPRSREATVLLALLDDSRGRIHRDELKADAIASPEGAAAATERAAWTVVARALLNLDETITKS
ncbi:MAG: PSD1 and planctomycete cytochrome C domain-containing protein [Verrucomicrobiales bacterium]